MSIEVLLIWVIVGALSGGLVSVVIKGYGVGPVGNALVGVIGSFLCSWLFGVVGIAIGSGIINTIFTAFIGAVASLSVLIFVRRGGEPKPVNRERESVQSAELPPPPHVELPRSPPPAPQPAAHRPADVFISYKREERARVERMAAALRDKGFNVWFDARLRSGHQFDEEINREVRAAKAVLVCWSKASVQSEWVRAEASIGRQRGVLTACFLEQCDPYPPFNLTHAEDLGSSALDDTNSAWLKIVQQLSQLSGRSAVN